MSMEDLYLRDTFHAAGTLSSQERNQSHSTSDNNDVLLIMLYTYRRERIKVV